MKECTTAYDLIEANGEKGFDTIETELFGKDFVKLSTFFSDQTQRLQSS